MATHHQNKNDPDNPIDKEKIIESKLSKFLSDIHEKGELTVKQAILMGQKRIYYIKGKDLVAYFKENFQTIANEIKTITNINIGSSPNETALQTFFTIFFEKKMLLKLNRIQGDKAKYPKALYPPARGEDIKTFDESKFYWLNLQQEASKKSLVYLLVAITIVLLGCMFPVWPLKIKIGFFWTIFALLLALLILTILSLVVVIVGLIFGYEIYILPNLLEPKMKWKDRLLNPFVAYFPREDSFLVILCRIGMGLGIVVLIVIAYLNPAAINLACDIFSNGSKRIYNYVLDKIINNHNSTRTSVSRADRHSRVLNDDLL